MKVMRTLKTISFFLENPSKIILNPPSLNILLLATTEQEQNQIKWCHRKKDKFYENAAFYQPTTPSLKFKNKTVAKNNNHRQPRK